MNRSCPTYDSEKARNILTFYWNSFFSIKIAFIIPFPAFLGELTSYLRKTNFFFSSEKKNICHFTKKVPFHRNFSIIFLLFHCFHRKISKKHWILQQYTFYWKKIYINGEFFNVFRSINGIFNKNSFYKYNICNLNKEENSA